MHSRYLLLRNEDHDLLVQLKHLRQLDQRALAAQQHAPAPGRLQVDCQKIKENIKGLGVICDVALDPYTTSGHDGIVINNKIDNDKTVEILCKQALVNANAGCDIIAPSDMMDGRIKVIRKYLDQYSFQDILIMSYAVKYASSYYGPFRNALESPFFGD